MIDNIDPAIAIPLAVILYLAWWLVERRAHKLGAGAAGAASGERARTRPGRTPNHETRSHHG